MTAAEQKHKDEQEFFKRERLFEPLIASDAWKELEAIGRTQWETQLTEILAAPDAGIDGITAALRCEYRKGVVFGIKLLLATPYATITTAKDIRQDLNRQSKGTSDGPARSDTSGEQLPDTAIVSDLG